MQKAHSRIHWENLPSINTPLGANNLNKMDKAIDVIDDRVLALYGYQDRVAQSEKNAKASEVNAKASETNAKQSELLAKQYSEKAFSGTPEGYEALVDAVRLMDIKETTDTTLANSKAGGYKLLSMSGKTVQNGTPTPDTPIAIQNVADCVEMIQGAWKNSTGEFMAGSQFVCMAKPVQCASGDNIKVVLENTMRYISIVYLNGDTYVSGASVESTNEATFTAPSGVTHFKVTCQISTSSTETVTPDTVGKITLTINGKYVLQIRTQKELYDGVADGKVYSLADGSVAGNNGWASGTNLIPCKSGERITVKHGSKVSLIRLFFYKTDGTWGGYKQSSEGVTEFSATADYDGYYRWAILDSVVNKPSSLVNLSVTSNMHESVATVLLDAPLCETDVMSRTEVNRKRASVVYDGSNDEVWGIETNSSGNVNFYNSLPNALGRQLVFCTHFKSVDFVGSTQNVYISSGKFLNIVPLLGFTTVAEWRTWLQSNPITVEYPLATPTTEVLDTDSQIALNSLETFNGATHINIDSRVKQSEIKGEYGTSKVGARTLKNELRNDTLEIKYNELAVALVATESGV